MITLFFVLNTKSMQCLKFSIEYLIAIFLQVLGLGWSSIFYIESIARVKKLSLSGLLLYKLRMADQFFVQWPQLQQKYPRAQYAGRLM